MSFANIFKQTRDITETNMWSALWIALTLTTVEITASFRLKGNGYMSNDPDPSEYFLIQIGCFFKNGSKMFVILKNSAWQKHTLCCSKDQKERAQALLSFKHFVLKL